MENKTYSIHIKCTNCGYKSSIPDEMLPIIKGITISEELLMAKCPDCGCTTLIKN